jgi:transposase
VWTRENRGLYERKGARYPSDLSDAEWALIAPLNPPAKRGGRPREVDVREVISCLTERGNRTTACRSIADVRNYGLEWPLWVDSSPSWLSHNRTLLRCRRRATFGQKWSFTGTMPKVRFPIRKRKIVLIIAAQNDFFEAVSALRSQSGRNWSARISSPHDPFETFPFQCLTCLQSVFHRRF